MEEKIAEALGQIDTFVQSNRKTLKWIFITLVSLILLNAVSCFFLNSAMNQLAQANTALGIANKNLAEAKENIALSQESIKSISTEIAAEKERSAYFKLQFEQIKKTMALQDASSSNERIKINRSLDSLEEQSKKLEKQLGF